MWCLRYPPAGSSILRPPSGEPAKPRAVIGHWPPTNHSAPAPGATKVRGAASPAAEIKDRERRREQSERARDRSTPTGRSFPRIPAVTQSLLSRDSPPKDLLPTTSPQPTPTMSPLRSILGSSTGALRQFLPSLTRQSWTRGLLSARSFSQLAKFSIPNSLRALRAGSQSSNVGVASVGSATGRQIEQVRGMKTRSAVKRLCDGCKVCGFFF